MTRPTLRKLHRIDVIVLNELRSQLDLVPGPGVVHVEDLAARTQVVLGRLVAFEAPAHRHGFVLPHSLHLMDGSVAVAATNALRHVNAVVEEDEVGHVVHPVPGYGCPGVPALLNDSQLGGVDPDLGVAGHAGLGCGNIGEVARFDGGVAVAAVQPHAAGVQAVGEGDGLLDRYAYLIVVGAGEYGQAGNEQHHENAAQSYCPPQERV